ncbi:MAG: hypothetical protein L6Q54_13250 [Leptospiraceae bacterium]|nr:hypothetical protein [Leptospiraceae bacterium]MCK6382201.1 hypothetical protein [Leptospiraceae bacterium]NUM42547.1 hypothetical protein [Leptospiraceae bacterium]
MEFILPILLGFIFLYLRRVWSDSRKVRAIGFIDRVTLCKIHPDIVSPEVEIRYKYYYDSGVYFGLGYILITDFIGKKEFNLYFDSKENAIFEMEGLRVFSEEHIEEYLLRNYSCVLILLDPVEPYRSEIVEVKKEKISVIS